MIMRGMLVSSLSFYMVYYLNVDIGLQLDQAALMLALFELAGVGGALAGGMLSDRYGRRSTVFVATVFGALLLFVFMLVVRTDVAWVPVALIPLGFVSLSITPVLQAVVQDQFPDNRATASGALHPLRLSDALGECADPGTGRRSLRTGRGLHHRDYRVGCRLANDRAFAGAPED